jgi:hypothetical protein
MSEKRNVRASQARNSVRDEESRPMTTITFGRPRSTSRLCPKVGCYLDSG